MLRNIDDLPRLPILRKFPPVITRLVVTPLQKACEIFGLDTRSLALFRILVAITALWDLADRARDLRAHYTDHGVIPRDVWLDNFWNYNWMFGSIFMISGKQEVVEVLFILNALIALSLLVGYKTRISTILSWIFVVSIHNRNYFVNHSGDWLHRDILLFAIFLPLGDCYSVDAALKKKTSREERASARNNTHSTKSSTEQSYSNDYKHLVVSMATVGFAIQILVMYYTAFYHKTGREWRETGTATWLALQMDFFKRDFFGDILVAFPNLTKMLTFSVVKWQGWGYYLFYSPFQTGPCKTMGAFGYALMHLGFGAGMRLGHFAWITCICPLGLLPDWFWYKFNQFLRRHKERLTFKVYYLDSGLSQTIPNIVRIISTFFLLPETDLIASYECFEAQYQVESDKYRAQQDYYHDKSDRDSDVNNTVVDVLPDHKIHTTNPFADSTSWLIAEDCYGDFHYGYDAVIAICRVSPILWIIVPFLKWNISRTIGKFIMNWIQAEEKYTLDHHHQQHVQHTKYKVKRAYARTGPSFLLQACHYFWQISNFFIWNYVCAILIYIVVNFNQGGLPAEYQPLAYSLGLEQYWGVFAPSPPTSHWWYNIQGQLDNGTVIELFTHGGVYSMEGVLSTGDMRPDAFVDAFKNHRWYKYYENGLNTSGKRSELLLNFGRYLCREYNMRRFGLQRMKAFKLFILFERVDLGKMDGSRIPSGKQLMWDHKCY